MAGKSYDSATDHKDKGDYLIRVTESFTFESVIDGKKDPSYWSASILYKTKTLKYVRTEISDSSLRLRKLKRYPDDLSKDEAQKEKAHNRLLPYLEKLREYRASTKKRYEVEREERWREGLPLMPEIPNLTNKK